VLLGSAVLGAVAAGDHPSVLEAMELVFQAMYRHQLAYRGVMG
jgi:ribulose kinase